MGLCFLLTSMLKTTRRSERSPRFWGDTWNIDGEGKHLKLMLLWNLFPAAKPKGQGTEIVVVLLVVVGVTALIFIS